MESRIVAKLLPKRLRRRRDGSNTPYSGGGGSDGFSVRTTSTVDHGDGASEGAFYGGDDGQARYDSDHHRDHSPSTARAPASASALTSKTYAVSDSSGGVEKAGSMKAGLTKAGSILPLGSTPADTGRHRRSHSLSKHNRARPRSSSSTARERGRLHIDVPKAPEVGLSDGLTKFGVVKPGPAAPDPDAAGTAPRESTQTQAYSRSLSSAADTATAATTRDQAPVASVGPVIVNTPPTPSYGNAASSSLAAAARNSQPDLAAANVPTSPASATATRRSRAGSATNVPSKLSNSTVPTATPLTENESRTEGFFSSMISAAQNAASSLSSTIQSGNSAYVSKASTGESDATEATADTSANANATDQVAVAEKRRSKGQAVSTLGEGELSLRQLGLAEPTALTGSPTKSSPTKAKLADTTGSKPDIQRALSTTSTTFVPTSENTGASAALDSGAPVALGSVMGSTTAAPGSPGSGAFGDSVTPVATAFESKADIGRSSTRGRSRGGSATTGMTSVTTQSNGTGKSGATVGAGTAGTAPPAGSLGSLIHPATPTTSSGPKLTGYAIVTKKRNRDFHSLFKTVPDDDYLIEDYSCALQREILVQGRLYVSEGHLCFSSNIFGWITTLVMSFDEIVAVEKRSTALVFRNGLMISTLHAKHIFASFVSRDATYETIVNIWKLGHPSLQSSLNGVKLDGTGGDRTEKIDDAAPAVPGAEDRSVTASDDTDDDDVYDEDEVDTLENNHSQPSDGAGPDAADGANKTTAVMANGDGGELLSSQANGAGAGGGSSGGSGGANDFPGPATHAPTDCGDSATHYDKILGDDVIPAPLGKVYSMVFGPDSGTWLLKWIATDQKCTEMQMEDKRGLAPDRKTRTYSYIRPLTATIGPRQTKCIVTESLDSFDLDKAVCVSVSTQNPDVPSGNIFCVKTKYCLSWAESNSTRIQINCTVEWTSKSWLKGPIEKGVNDGQGQYVKDLMVGLKAALSRSQSAAGASAGAAANELAKGKKAGRKGRQPPAPEPLHSPADTKTAPGSGWGVLEPVHGLATPLLDIVQPLLTGNVMYGILVGLLVALWFGFNRAGGSSGGTRGHADALSFGADPFRAAAYEEMWRREESELWDWLEDRAGLSRLAGVGSVHPPVLPRPRSALEGKLRDERMDDRDMEEAVRVTEQKLRLLKTVLAKKRQAAVAGGT